MNSLIASGAVALSLALAGAIPAKAAPSAVLAAGQQAKREAGAAVATRMLGPRGAKMASYNTSQEFGHELGDMAARNVFGELWTRPGLTPKERSLVTMSILIGSHQMNEFKIHVVAAVRNGVSIAEIEEVILQSSAYAGFPAAADAKLAAQEALTAAGLIK